MPAPKLPTNASLTVIRDDLVFIKARCAADPKAADQAELLAALIARWSEVNEAQYACWDAQTVADALIGAADDRLDEIVDRFSVGLLGAVGQKRSDPRYKLYFKQAPAELKRPVLGPELETIRGWLQHLGKETEPALAPFAAEFSSAVKQADKAIKARRTADAENDAFRKTGGLAELVAEVERGRDAVYTALDGRRNGDASLPRGWEAGFFRHRKAAPPNGADRAARDEKKAAEKAAAAARKQAIVEQKAKIKEAQKALRDLEGTGKKKKK